MGKRSQPSSTHVRSSKKKSHKTSHSVRAAVLENRKAGILGRVYYHLTGKMSLPKPQLKNLMAKATAKHCAIGFAIAIPAALYTHFHYAATYKVITDYFATVDHEERWARLQRHGV